MNIQERLAAARELMKQSDPNQRIHTDENGHLVLRDIGVLRHKEPEPKTLKLSKNATRACRAVVGHRESKKNARFARDDESWDNG